MDNNIENNIEDISYKEEQIQYLLMNELKDNRNKEYITIIDQQNKEYQEALSKDKSAIEKKSNKFEEIPMDEMRLIRLKRFSK